MILIRSMLGVVCIVYTIFVYADYKELAFLNGSIQEFVQHMTHDLQQQEEFKKFYQAMNKKLYKAGKEKRKKGCYHFTQRALKEMPIQHPIWYEKIKPFIKDIVIVLDSKYDPIRKVISCFVTRYGAYYQFLDYKRDSMLSKYTVVVRNDHRHSSNMWSLVKSSVTRSASYVYDVCLRGIEYMKSVCFT